MLNGGAGEPVCIVQRTRVAGNGCVVIVGQSHEHTCQGAGQRFWRQTGVLHRLP